MKYKCSTNADNAGKPFWPADSVYLKGKAVNKVENIQEDSLDSISSPSIQGKFKLWAGK